MNIDECFEKENLEIWMCDVRDLNYSRCYCHDNEYNVYIESTHKDPIFNSHALCYNNNLVFDRNISFFEHFRRCKKSSRSSFYCIIDNTNKYETTCNCVDEIDRSQPTKSQYLTQSVWTYNIHSAIHLVKLKIILLYFSFFCSVVLMLILMHMLIKSIINRRKKKPMSLISRVAFSSKSD